MTIHYNEPNHRHRRSRDLRDGPRSARPHGVVEDAHRIVEQRCGPYTDDEDALATVETYLAAHLATAKDTRVSQGSHGGIQVTYEASGERYWYKAVLADPTNRLARPGGYATFST